MGCLAAIMSMDGLGTSSIDELQLKGIFILPKEANMEVWRTISEARSSSEESRCYEKNPVTYSFYKRLIQGKQLDDPGLNAYIALMKPKKRTFICTTYIFPLLFDKKRVLSLKRNVRAYISYISTTD
jgi:hypothetical protein